MALKLHNRRWYPLIFLLASATAIAFWCYTKLGHRPELLLSGIGTAGGLTYFLYRQHLDETKLFNELLVAFNKRYDELNDSLNNILAGTGEGEFSAVERERLFSYFNLCDRNYFFIGLVTSISMYGMHGREE